MWPFSTIAELRRDIATLLTELGKKNATVRYLEHELAVCKRKLTTSEMALRQAVGATMEKGT